MENNERMTALITPVAAGAEQSPGLNTSNSIPDSNEDFNYDGPVMTEEEFSRITAEEIFRQEKEANDPNHLPTMSMTELYERIYTRKKPIIDGLLYPGTYLFAGAPKLGKSFLMLQLAYHVSTGTPLWGFPVQQWDVLYLSLEDDHARLQGRLYRMFGANATEHLHLCTKAHTIQEGLAIQLSRFLVHHQDTGLVIIDTLQKIRDVYSDTYSYSNDYQLIAYLKSLAEYHGICLILVHHTRKQQSDDSFDMVSGTNGLTGAADATLILSKAKRTGGTASLQITGRDQEDQIIHLVRNEENLCWGLERLERELWKTPPDPLLERVSQLILPGQEEWTGSPSQLQTFLGVDMKPNVLTQRLNINAARLFDEHSIEYWNKRTHLGRRVGLKCVKPA